MGTAAFTRHQLSLPEQEVSTDAWKWRNTPSGFLVSHTAMDTTNVSEVLLSEVLAPVFWRPIRMGEIRIWLRDSAGSCLGLHGMSHAPNLDPNQPPISSPRVGGLVWGFLPPNPNPNPNRNPNADIDNRAHGKNRLLLRRVHGEFLPSPPNHLAPSHPL